jgi:hypothetical protein
MREGLETCLHLKEEQPVAAPPKESLTVRAASCGLVPAKHIKRREEGVAEKKRACEGAG